MSASVLFAAELGDGLGHVARLLPIARALAARGHDVRFAVPDLVAAGPLLRASRIRALQSPLFRAARPQRHAAFQPRTYADILAVNGFLDPDALETLCGAWAHLLDSSGARLLVADHAPAACLAALGRAPAVLAGYGFTLPPSRAGAFAPLQPHVPETAPQAEVLACAREVLRRRGAPPLAALADLLEPAGRFLCSYPELDPYAAARREPLLGPLEPLAPRPPPAGAARCFAYLAGDDPRLEALTLGLLESGLHASVVVRQPPPFLRGLLRETRVRLLESFTPVEAALGACRVVLHHGGTGTAEAALACGRPQVLAPRHLEQRLTGEALGRLGAGASLVEGVTPERVAAALRAGAEEDALARAGAAAAAIAARAAGRALETVLARCEALLTG